MIDLNEYLRKNPYPGRGILLGRSADNRKAVIAYFIMGRSENSRNRVFEETADGIRTRAFDESKMTDPPGAGRHFGRAAPPATPARQDGGSGCTWPPGPGCAPPDAGSKYCYSRNRESRRRISADRPSS